MLLICDQILINVGAYNLKSFCDFHCKQLTKPWINLHGRRQRGAGGPWPPWVFKHGTNIVDGGLKVLFFGPFLLFFDLFSVGPPMEEAK